MKLEPRLVDFVEQFDGREEARLDEVLKEVLVGVEEGRHDLFPLAKRLLQWKDRLRTWHELHGEEEEEDETRMPGWDAIEPEGLPTLDIFCRADLVDLGLELATRMPKTHVVLETLLKRHGSNKALLRILEAVPCTCDPSSFRDWWPSGREEDGRGWLQPWRRGEAVYSFERMSETTTPDELLSWYRKMALEAEQEVGVERALLVLEMGRGNGLLELERDMNELRLGARLGLPWQEWQALDDRERLRRTLASPAPALMAHLEALQALWALEETTLLDALAVLSLDKLAIILEHSRPTEPVAQRVVKNDLVLARLALVACYTHTGLFEWTFMTRIFECLPAFDVEAEAPTTLPSSPDRTAWQSATGSLSIEGLSYCLDQLDVHLDAAESFSKWSGQPIPLIWCIQAQGDHDAQRTQVSKAVESAAVEKGDTPSWLECCDELVRLQADREPLKGVLSALTVEVLQETVLSSILARGDFVAVKDIMYSPWTVLSDDVKERLVITASRQFYDRASGGNMRNLDIKQAYECLAIAPQTKAIAQEKEFIEATSKLSSFKLESRPGVPLTPREIRSAPDRFQLIARILATNQNAHLHGPLFLSLMDGFGYKNDRAAEARLYATLVDAALGEPDFESAAQACDHLIEVLGILSRRKDDFAPACRELAWEKCFQLGRQNVWQDFERRSALLNRAIVLAPESHLPEIVDKWMKLEERILAKRQESGKPGPSPTAKPWPVASPITALPPLSRQRASRERKRDLLGKMVKTRLTSGVGWLIGAEQQQRQDQHRDEEEDDDDDDDENV